MNSPDGPGTEPGRLALAFVDRLAALGDQAHRERTGDMRLLADTAIGLGRTWGWREGALRGVMSATTAAVAAGRLVDAIDTALIIIDTARELRHAAHPLPLPRSVGVPNVDLTGRGPGIVAVLGTIAYHDAWHTAHASAFVAVVRALEDALGTARHGPTWQRVRATITDAVHADRAAGPFAAPSGHRGAFIAAHLGHHRATRQDAPALPAPAQGSMPGGRRGRSR